MNLRRSPDAPVPAGHAPPDKLPTPTILIVEDDEDFTRFLDNALGTSGYNVLHARNGMAALRLYQPSTIQLVLTDVVMPDMDGLELIMQLRKLDPNVKIVAMSGGGVRKIEVYLPIAKHLGAAAILAKPFTIQDLLIAIRLAL